MHFNLIHCAEPGSVYETFSLQQQYAHQLGLRTTVLVQGNALTEPAIVDQLKEWASEFGDELGLSLSGFDQCRWFSETIGGIEEKIWLYSKSRKRHIIQHLTDDFHHAFGYCPRSVGAYHLDSECMAILTAVNPSAIIGIAGCFEEGAKVFHGCNNSWYLFNEGMPWAPWYPARDNALRPAETNSEWAGIVAVPHLCRDLALSYEGRNDFFASHSANVQRAMANRGLHHPYDFNLVDLYRMQEDYNVTPSYYQVFVNPHWLTGHQTIHDPPEVSRKLYYELLEYMVSLRQQGQLHDMTMSEYGEWFTANVKPGGSQVHLAKEILYGSKKQIFWYIDPHLRATVDINLGGSIGDLRPYIGKLPRSTGADSPHLVYGSYPYCIHSQYRTGISHHFCDGSRTTLLIGCNGETIDCARYRCAVAAVRLDQHSTELQLMPLSIHFASGETVELQTLYRFVNDGTIEIIRRVAQAPGSPPQLLTLTEYVKGCWGSTEYPEDMHGIRLGLETDPLQTLDWQYEGRTLAAPDVKATWARIPQLNSQLSLQSLEGAAKGGQATEGILFNPYYTLKLDYTIKETGVCRSCLKITALQ